MNSMIKLTKARTNLVLDSPFFANIALRLKLIEDKNIPTAGTDGTVLIYNPKFIDSLNMEEIKGVFYHEVMHIVLMHHLRAGNRKHEKWNEACDYAINPILENVDIKLPKDVLLDSKYKNMMAEEIYSKLPDEKEGGKQGCGWGEVMQQKNPDGSKMTKTQIKKAENDMKVTLQQSVNLDKNAGKLGGDFKRLINEIIEPQISWREILRDFLTKTIKNDYSWKRPNKRYIGSGFYLPSIDGQTVGNIIIAVDTSGSISEKDLAKFSGEINSILESFQGVELDVIYCDTQVNKVEHFESRDLPVELNFYGGGGTKFKPVFDWIEQKEEMPDALLYFTDLDCWDTLNFTPDFPVLWITDNESKKMPFGSKVILK